ncbi:MAG: recombination-associated protein RdgC [Pseudomonadota bacterium]
MGISRGGVTLTRYETIFTKTSNFWDFVDRRIRANLFLPIDEGTEEQGVGWCSIHDYLDTTFAYASYALDPYVVLGLRVDRRRVPASLIKRQHRQEVAKALALCEGRGLSRADREDLKEKVRLDLLRRTVPQTEVLEVVWNTANGELWVATASRGKLDIFEDLFRRTFDIPPIPRIPWLLAQDLHPAAKADLEALRPASLYNAEVA